MCRTTSSISASSSSRASSSKVATEDNVRTTRPYRSRSWLRGRVSEDYGRTGGHEYNSPDNRGPGYGGEAQSYYNAPSCTSTPRSSSSFHARPLIVLSLSQSTTARSPSTPLVKAVGTSRCSRAPWASSISRGSAVHCRAFSRTDLEI